MACSSQSRNRDHFFKRPQAKDNKTEVPPVSASADESSTTRRRTAPMAEFRAALQKAAEKMVTENGTSTASKETRSEERRIPEKDPLQFRIPPVERSRNLEEEARRQINGRQESRHIDPTGANEGQHANSNLFGKNLVCQQMDLNDPCVPSTIFFNQADYDDSAEEYIFVDTCPVEEGKDMYPRRGLMNRFSLKYAVVSGVGWVLDRMEFGRAGRILEFEMTATIQTKPDEATDKQQGNHLALKEEAEQVE